MKIKRELALDWVNKEYTYEDTDHIHAVTSLVVTDENNNQTTNIYRYDANGNMTCRIEGGETFLQAYNAENRMSGVLLVTGDCDTLGDTLKAWEFTYDGDGVKVEQEYTDSNGTITTYYYMGGSYEVQTDGSSETVRQYYSLAGVTTGMREGSTFYYFLTDHLGSVVGVTDSTGTMVSETRYLPFGEIRTDVGTISQTDYGYTFQRNVAQMGLMDYKARYYSSLLGRFTQPDSIIPGAGNPQSWNRYSYVNNRPTNFTDPTGHCPECLILGGIMVVGGLVGYGAQVVNNLNSGMNFGEALTTDISAKQIIDTAILTPAIVLGSYALAGVASESATQVALWTNSPTIYNVGQASKSVQNSIGTALTGMQPNKGTPLEIGNAFHYDQLNGSYGESGPSQLQNMYPDTEFKFAERGASGVDVEVTGGFHPSTYPGSKWPSGFDYGDFKPNSSSGYTSFYSNLNSGKYPINTIPLPYNSTKFKLLEDFFFGK